MSRTQTLSERSQQTAPTDTQPVLSGSSRMTQLCIQPKLLSRVLNEQKTLISFVNRFAMDRKILPQMYQSNIRNFMHYKRAIQRPGIVEQLKLKPTQHPTQLSNSLCDFDLIAGNRLFRAIEEKIAELTDYQDKLPQNQYKVQQLQSDILNLCVIGAELTSSFFCVSHSINHYINHTILPAITAVAEIRGSEINRIPPVQATRESTYKRSYPINSRLLTHKTISAFLNILSADALEKHHAIAYCQQALSHHLIGQYYHEIKKRLEHLHKLGMLSPTEGRTILELSKQHQLAAQHQFLLATELLEVSLTIFDYCHDATHNAACGGIISNVITCFYATIGEDLIQSILLSVHDDVLEQTLYPATMKHISPQAISAINTKELADPENPNYERALKQCGELFNQITDSIWRSQDQTATQEVNKALIVFLKRKIQDYHMRHIWLATDMETVTKAQQRGKALGQEKISALSRKRTAHFFQPHSAQQATATNSSPTAGKL